MYIDKIAASDYLGYTGLAVFGAKLTGANCNIWVKMIPYDRVGIRIIDTNDDTIRTFETLIMHGFASYELTW